MDTISSHQISPGSASPEIPRYTRLPRVPFRLPWAKRSLGFQPVVPDDPIVPDFARQTGHHKKFANSLIRENIYEHC